MRNCVSKTRHFVFEMMIFAGHVGETGRYVGAANPWMRAALDAIHADLSGENGITNMRNNLMAGSVSVSQPRKRTASSGRRAATKATTTTSSSSSNLAAVSAVSELEIAGGRSLPRAARRFVAEVRVYMPISRLVSTVIAPLLLY